MHRVFVVFSREAAARDAGKGQQVVDVAAVWAMLNHDLPRKCRGWQHAIFGVGGVTRELNGVADLPSRARQRRVDEDLRRRGDRWWLGRGLDRQRRAYPGNAALIRDFEARLVAFDGVVKVRRFDVGRVIEVTIAVQVPFVGQHVTG